MSCSKLAASGVSAWWREIMQNEKFSIWEGVTLRHCVSSGSYIIIVCPAQVFQLTLERGECSKTGDGMTAEIPSLTF
jgi:hypothetical protein